MKKLIIFLILLGLLADGIYLALNSNTVTERIVQWAFKKYVKNITLEKFTVGEQDFYLNGTFEVRGVVLDYRDSAGGNSISFNRIHLSSLYPLIASALDSNLVKISFEEGKIKTPAMSVDACRQKCVFNYDPIVDGKFSGDINIEQGVYDSLKFEKALAHVEGNLEKIKVGKIFAQLYDGFLSGDLLLELKENNPYYGMINLTGVNINKLAVERPDIFSQIEGVANIAAKFRGNQKGIINIEAEGLIEKNGKINAILLQPLLAYIPQSVQRKDIELLISRQQKIEVDKTMIKLKNIDNEKINSAIQLTSKRYNLDINLDVDLNIEGGISNLFTFTRQNIKSNNK